MRLLICLLLLIPGFAIHSQDSIGFSRQELIYGRKDGMALTMEKLQPQKNANGKAILYILSGNYQSTAAWMQSAEGQSAAYLRHGYTVFLVVHGSQPRYTVEDAVYDLRRAVRFVRYHAKAYKINPNQIGITGGSSGGHLALLVATDDRLPDTTAKDPVNRVSSRVQAAAVFYPLTDLLNYGGPGLAILSAPDLLIKAGVAAAFDFKRWNDSLQTYIALGPAARLTITRLLSPLYAVTADDPPVLIFHGDADEVVPLQQSEVFIAKLKEVKLTHELIIKKGAGHGWDNEGPEMEKAAAWFDKYLKP